MTRITKKVSVLSHITAEMIIVGCFPSYVRELEKKKNMSIRVITKAHQRMGREVDAKEVDAKVQSSW